MMNIYATVDVAAVTEEVVEGVYAGQVYQDISSTEATSQSSFMIHFPFLYIILWGMERLFTSCSGEGGPFLLHTLGTETLFAS